MKGIFTIILGTLLIGCTTAPKLLEVDTPAGYACKVHGENPRSYKVGSRYFCTVCVDENLGQVELITKREGDQ